MSIEQLGDFHLVRRVLRTVAPDFRLLASPDLQSHQCVLDLQKKTIEIGEQTPILEAVAAMLFQVGHLRHRDTPRFNLIFGKDILEWEANQPHLISRLAALGNVLDHLSAAWAEVVFCQYWDMKPDLAKAMIHQYVWPQSEWKEYFSV